MSRLFVLVVLVAVYIQVDGSSLVERIAPCKSCRKYCEKGFVLGPDGCPAPGCKCCPEVMCLMACPYGFVKENGCEICKCACSPVMCAMHCENGFVKDENGCDKCQCA